MARVAVVDDEAAICEALSELLGTLGHEAAVYATAEAALAGPLPDAMLLDVNLPGMDGFAALERLLAKAPDLPVIVITARGSPADAIEAMKRGAYDFLVKPLDLEMVRLRLEKALERKRLSAEVSRLARAGPAAPAGLTGVSAPMREVAKRLGAVASTEATVLLLGETGTGKELAARAIHAASPRAKGPFRALNCAAVPEGTLQSELFGHEKGAFTGALARKTGRLEEARGGTLLLDEVAEMPPAMQSALLRFLEERTFLRVGGTEPVSVDVRIVAATHRDLGAFVAEGRFREDLAFRLRVVEIRMPPLRDRLEDLPALVAAFLAEAGHPGSATEEAMAALRRHRWRGNVRELRHAVLHAAILARGRPVGLEHLPATVLAAAAPPGAEEVARIVDRAASAAPEGGVWDAVETAFGGALLRKVLAETQWNQTEAARRLGMHRSTLKAKMETYGLGEDRHEP